MARRAREIIGNRIKVLHLPNRQRKAVKWIKSQGLEAGCSHAPLAITFECDVVEDKIVCRYDWKEADGSPEPAEGYHESEFALDDYDGVLDKLADVCNRCGSLIRNAETKKVLLQH